jgi:flavin reductase (DIM6/NTAB) family NADH-FMN oxidoreductase RutF
MSLEDTQALLKNVDPIVWLVTSQNGERRGGLVATWVNESSLDATAPRIMLGLAPHHFTTELIRESGRLVLHQIATEEMDHYWPLCLEKGRDVEKLAGMNFTSDAWGQPRLEPCIGYLSCQVFSQLNTGDRVYFWCDIQNGEKFSDAAPIRQGQLFALAGAERLQKLRNDRERDSSELRPAFQKWRDSLTS